MFGSRKPVDKIYGIIGLGRFGTALARSLADAGKEILVIDYDEERFGKSEILQKMHL